MEIQSAYIQGNEPVLIEFIGQECEPCAILEPTLEQVNQVLGKRMRITLLYLSDAPELVKKYEVTSVPTLLLFQEGELKWRTQALFSKEELIEKILKELD
ncbi:thioredoxin family protein [Flavobacterium stagni]|uniref:Thioredoxin n=1 Tax=Flavobacterium stagni TaxID=2506421 RepID=A0A4Q1KB30_9FLAO|nr:thioredoxin family protein [Flavobacterium stagni]RXR24105.1 thioredoxin [Flavobacterium stagni]